MPDFVHLHVHPQYSILDGAAAIKPLIKRAKALGMNAIAITDHGNMYGVKNFHDTATDAGVKPILGCEVYVVKNRFEKDKDEKAGDHLILLAKNLEGYHNLCKMVSYSFTEGFYYKPRIDKQLIEQYHGGLICCSACLGGEVPQAIMHNDIEEAERVVQWFKNIFGEDYYLELQLHPSGDPQKDADVYENQLRVNKVILELAAKYGVKYICSNDVHFILAEDAVAHDHLICLNTGRDLDDPNRMRYTFQEYLKSPEEMAALFPDHPEALATTLEIADKCEDYKLTHAPLMPNFPPPEDFPIALGELRESFVKKIEDEEMLAKIGACATVPELEELVAGDKELSDRLMVAKQYCYLKDLTYKGAHMRYGDVLDEKTEERIKYELSTIEWMGFPGYFLIVWDYIRAAREMGVSVGPGRGSAAGSVVAYCLKITNIDPLKYDLLFERFLNPERISLPDVDVDFDEDGRADVLRYCVQKYGQKRVAQIVTFGTMAPKMAIKDVARVQKLALSESDRLSKLVPDKVTPDKKHGETPFDFVYKESPELAAERESPNQLIRNTLKYAEKLEGSIRQTGVHACGVIIGQDDLEKFAPMAIAKDAELNVVEFEGKEVESVGLIKMDFLGLRTLSIIKDAVENVKAVHGVDVDIDGISLDDAPTYEVFARGDTTGLFQFESPGMKKHLRNLKPNRFEDLIAMNALYRPGPMEYIPNFIARKHGQEPVTYEIADMEEYLNDTYGITVYQEQVMLLSQKLAGFTGGEADTLRKAMGKKKRDVLDKMKPKFIEGCKQRGHDEKICDKIWGDWEAFASYAFNKSHSTCYAYVAYQTGYLKAHYPFGVHGGPAEPKPRGHQAAHALHERVQAHGNPCARSGHQRIDAHLLVQQGGRRALRSGGREGRRRSRRGEHHRGAQRQRPFQGHIRPDGARELLGRKPQVFRESGLCRRFRLDIGLPPRQVLRCGRARQYGRDLHRAADALRPAFSGREEQRPAESLRRWRTRGYPAPRAARMRRLEPARNAGQGARDDRSLPLGAPARRLQDHHQPHVQDPAHGAGKPRSAQGAGDRRRGYGRQRAEPHHQDRQAVGQIRAGGLQRHA